MVARVIHSKASSQGTITGTDWDADHTVEGVATDDHTHADKADASHAHDYSASGHSHDITHEHDADYSPVGHDHSDAYSALAHTHDTTHSHTAADVGASATGHTHAYADPDHTHDTSHSHDLTGYSQTNHTHPGGSEAFPVGSVFLSVVSTDPASLLGYGTWQAFGAGRMLLGWDTGDTDEATGGATTHTHAAHSGVLSHSHNVTDPGHAHVENSNNATTGPLRGWGAADTSTNTSTATGYSTASATTGLTVDSAGSGAEYTHDSPSHMPPYVIVRMWKRTA